jgi:hypothetical protein
VRHTGVLAQAEQLAFRRFLAGEAAFQLVPADIVGPPLDQGHLDRPVQGGSNGFEQPRQVPANDLRLERKRGRGHQGGLVAFQGVGDEGYQVGQRLAGARACLDQEVVPRSQRTGHLPGHLMLALTALSAHAGNGPVEQFNHELLAGRLRGFRGHDVSHC